MVNKIKKLKATLFPKALRFLIAVGDNIRLARKRRHWSAENLAERAGISRTTLVSIEKGSPGVSIGHYTAVLFALGLAEDLAKLAGDDPDGRALQDIETLSPAARKKR
jgi:transcriptional regulator with XRE-family HTH domain